MHQPRKGPAECLGQRVGRFIDENRFEIDLIILVILLAWVWITLPGFRMYIVWGIAIIAALLFIITLVFFPWIFVAILVAIVLIPMSWRVNKTMEKTKWGKKDGA